jgi:hypothetical protein
MRPELAQLFDRTELSKYLTDEELAEFDAAAEGVAASDGSAAASAAVDGSAAGSAAVDGSAAAAEGVADKEGV